MTRTVNVAVAQLGALSEDKSANIDLIVKTIEDVAAQKPDFILFPEMATTPFFALGLRDPRFFDMGEPIPGPATERVGEAAVEANANVILPMYEYGEREGEHFNSAVVIGRDGRIVHGTLPNGETVRAYRKVNPGDYKWETGVTDEKYYFRPGPGYATFDTDCGRIGILICYDRWFPEGYRVLGLRGAEIVFVPVASSGFVGDLFIAGLRTHAAENAYYVVGCNKAGVEKVDDVEAHYYGQSAIVGPRGQVLAQAADAEPDLITGELDLDAITEQRRKLFVYRDRRPELYDPICEVGGKR
jgi:N-carbamoylputrescine amidase